MTNHETAAEIQNLKRCCHNSLRPMELGAREPSPVLFSYFLFLTNKRGKIMSLKQQGSHTARNKNKNTAK